MGFRFHAFVFLCVEFYWRWVADSGSIEKCTQTTNDHLWCTLSSCCRGQQDHGEWCVLCMFYFLNLCRGKSPRIWNLSQPTAKNNHETFDGKLPFYRIHTHFLGHFKKLMLIHQIIFTSTSFADNFMHTIILACTQTSVSVNVC